MYTVRVDKDRERPGWFLVQVLELDMVSQASSFGEAIRVGNDLIAEFGDSKLGVKFRF